MNVSVHRETILLLCHRIPYPPNKGDKIRSYHLLQFLRQHYRVVLGCFVDHPEDMQHVPRLERDVAELFALPVHPWQSQMRMLHGLLRGVPLSLARYDSKAMHRWVQRAVATHAIGKAVVFSSQMGQFAEPLRLSRRIIDFVDVDSDKWAQYAGSHRGLLRWLYRREHRTLSCYEQRLAEQFDHSIFVSACEASLFAGRLKQLEHKVQGIENGVNTDYFDPSCLDGKDSAPYRGVPGQVLVFTGAMDYLANVDAVCWFCDEIWPELKRLRPSLSFYIVGTNPTERVRRLGRLAGVTVTGKVEDIRPYLGHADLVVAPLRIARGIQNKVLEAMAMARPVIATRMAWDGLQIPAGQQPFQPDSPQQWAEMVGHLLNNPTLADGLGRENRRHVRDRYSWQACLGRWHDLLN